ncbi:putative protein kinase UbiB [mine drainage metagenome]|uniref:ABC1 atypical kinase-like domain-containing protein n=1 Tax=mine drainage metagenome TaxID=410659 RepID=A0A1J5SQ58_9ZZZZ
MLFARFRRFTRAVEHAQRYRTIVGVFLKYGYVDLAQHLPLSRLWIWLRSHPLRRGASEIGALSRPERLRRAFEELGPAFVKLGQLLAGRTRLLPRDYTDELVKLHDQVPPVDFREVEALITGELHQPPDRVFSRIDPKPLGSASIAQVHRAISREEGEVVIKVQRPDIERIVHVDLEIMMRIAELLERNLETWQPHQPSAIVAEFARRMEQELDFSAEAAAMERFARQFEGEATVCVPRVLRALSTRRMLTMECVDGVSASQLEALDAAGLDRREIARRLGNLTFRQIFVHGFFHGDPHPGNIHVLPDNVICFLDFGMTGFLERSVRDKLAALLVAVARKDEREATAALVHLAGAELEPPKPGLEADIAEFIQRHFTGPMKDLVFPRLLQQLLRITARHSLTLPPEVFLVIKVLGQVEGLVGALDPDYDFLEQAGPFVREIYGKRAQPGRIMRELLQFGGETVEALRALPMDIRRVAAQLRDGRAAVNFRVEGLRPLNETLERTTNRLAFAVVLAAMIVASALVIHSGIAPKWHGIPVIGLAGYVFAALMAATLLISMVRHGRM